MYSVFLGKTIQTPGFQHMTAKSNVAPRVAPAAPGAGQAAASIESSGHSAGFSAPGTFVMAMVFITAFALYYFVNWKYLSTVWPLK